MANINITHEELQDLITNSVKNAVHSAMQNFTRDFDLRNNREWFNADAAVDYINNIGGSICKSTLYKRVCYNKLRSFKMGKSLMFKRSDLDQYVEDERQSKNPTSIADLNIQIARCARKKLQD